MKAIFFHLFYTDLLDEGVKYMKRLPFEYDLYVTIPIGSKIKHKILQFKHDAHIIEVPNRGFDVGPFLEAINLSFSLNKEYDWVLKIHTKRSIKRNKNGDKWRIRFYEKLMPLNFSNINLLLNSSEIGMIGDAGVRMGLSPLDKRNRTNINGPNVNKLIKKFNLSNKDLDFFSGTMFWVKYDALKTTFKENKVTCIDFEDKYKPDGTLAHAYERVFANIVKSHGYKLEGI